VRDSVPHLSLGWRRLLFGVALVSLLGFVVSSQSAHAALLRFLDGVSRTAALHPGLAAILVVLFSGFAAMAAFVSSWLVVPLAVGTWGATVALLLVWGGWILGGAASYAIGRWFGPAAARYLGFGSLLARYEERVSHRTPFLLAFLFQLALPSEVRGYLFGLGRYAFGQYLLSLALAELPFGVATIYLGAGIVQGSLKLVAAMGAALVLMSVWAGYALRRRLMTRRDEREGSLPSAGTPAAG
jgi:uncharacterized membrane protein YdjX (TVP38/TMEM64 family)